MFQSNPLFTLTLFTLLLAPILSQSQNTLPNIQDFKDNSLFLENSAIMAASSNKESGKFMIEFFVESMTDDTMKFFQTFYPHYEKMKQDIEIVPHYIFKVCGKCLEENNFVYNLSNCVSGGRYCRTGPEVFQNWLQRDIILQSIRELCIYKESPEKWWEYQSALAQCDKACYDDIYAEIGLSKDEIYKCAKDSFENGDEMNDNKLLREQKIVTQNYTVAPNHTIFFTVNNLKIGKQSNSASALVADICNAYQGLIGYCKTYKSSPTNKADKVENTSSVSGFSLFIGLLALGFLGYVFYVRSLKKNEGSHIGIQLDETVSQYFALEDEDTKKAVRRISMQKMQKEKEEISESD